MKHREQPVTAHRDNTLFQVCTAFERRTWIIIHFRHTMSTGSLIKNVLNHWASGYAPWSSQNTYEIGFTKVTIFNTTSSQGVGKRSTLIMNHSTSLMNSSTINQPIMQVINVLKIWDILRAIKCPLFTVSSEQNKHHAYEVIDSGIY